MAPASTVLLLAVFAAAAAPASAARVFAATVIDPASPTLGLRVVTADAPGPLAGLSALAFGSFDDTIATTGWSFLDVTTNASAAYTDAQTAAAAGLLEGTLTAARSAEFIANLHNSTSTFSPALEAYVVANVAWVRAEAARLGGTDPLWHQIGLLYAHLDGMFAGFNATVPPPARLDFLTYYAATLVGDMDDLCVVFGCTAVRARRGDGHCSVLVKAVADAATGTFTDLYAAHTTWDPLECMTRVWKSYVFPWALVGAPAAQAARGAAVGAPSRAAGATGRGRSHVRPLGAVLAPPAPGAAAAAVAAYDADVLTAAVAAGAVVPGVSMVFSSFPGVAYSFDDWYQVAPSRLVVTETTIANANAALWANVTATGAISDWARNMAANRLADSGAEWMAVFARFNSGTYNNMFSVVDYKRFTPGAAALTPGLLVVGEQVRACVCAGTRAARVVRTGAERPAARPPIPPAHPPAAQMPGYFVSEDRTDWLAAAPPPSAGGPGQGYWASYNRPSFPLVFNVSGQPALVAAYGAHFDFAATARAVIFRRDQGAVADEAALRALMRYNGFGADAVGGQGCPGGGRSASNAIAERGDLTPADSGCCAACGLGRIDEAAIDAKYTTAAGMRAGAPLASGIISGPPTTGDARLPPFVWSTSPFAALRHAGQPDEWNFAWQQVDGP